MPLKLQQTRGHGFTEGNVHTTTAPKLFHCRHPQSSGMILFVGREPGPLGPLRSRTWDSQPLTPRERGQHCRGPGRVGVVAMCTQTCVSFWLDFCIALCHSGGTRGTKDPKDRGTSALLEQKWLGDECLNVRLQGPHDGATPTLGKPSPAQQQPPPPVTARKRSALAARLDSVRPSKR